MKINNVIFDIGNVLADFCWLDHMHSLSFSQECIDELTQNMILSPLWDELDMGIRPDADIVADMKNAAPMYAGEIDRFFADMGGIVRERPASLPWLKELKAHGVRIYLLSNYPRQMFELHSRTFSFIPLTDGMVVSSFVNLMKPNPEIYRLLLTKYSLRAEECVFVDDRPVNTDAAEKLGIRSVVYREAKQAHDELDALLKA